MFVPARWPIPLVLIGLSFVRPAVAAPPHVNDEAKLFSAAAVEKADVKLRQILDETGKQLQIDTVAAVPADQKQKLDSLGNKEFFVRWTRQRAETAKIQGIYALIVKSPGHLEILIDGKTRRGAYRGADREQLVKKLLPLFDDNRFDDALQTLVDGVQQGLRTNLGIKAPATTPSTSPVVSTPASTSKPLPSQAEKPDDDLFK